MGDALSFDGNCWLAHLVLQTGRRKKLRPGRVCYSTEFESFVVVCFLRHEATRLGFVRDQHFTGNDCDYALPVLADRPDGRRDAGAIFSLGFLRNAIKRCSVVFELTLDNYVAQCFRVVRDLFIPVFGHDKTVSNLGAEGFGDTH